MATEKTPEATAEVQRQLDLAHSQLALYARDLKRTVDAERQKAQELSQAHARLHRLDRLKTNFLRFISHELRTPLNAMVALDWLDPHGDPQEQAEVIALVRGGHERLQGLVTKGLAYFEWLATPAVETSETTDLTMVIRLAAERLSTCMTSGARVLLSAPDVSYRVRGKAQHLTEVVQILLDNAMKFSGQEKSITVDVRATPQGATLTVRDRGRGFPPEWASELFRPFTLLDMAHHTQGTGLSLALARAILEAHGGQLWGESEGPGQGATFTAVFPAASLPQTNNTGHDLS